MNLASPLQESHSHSSRAPLNSVVMTQYRAHDISGIYVNDSLLQLKQEADQEERTRCRENKKVQMPASVFRVKQFPIFRCNC